MRQGWVWAVVIAAVGSISSCSQKAAVAATPEDVLVLEVGGDQPSLRASLVALGREVGPAHALAPRPLPGPGGYVGPDFRAGGGGSPAVEYAPDLGNTPPDLKTSDPETAGPETSDDGNPAPEPVSEWVTVPLPDGETLIHLARRHLGDGRRFPELLEWNGWSEQEARRLNANQPVKIKRSEMR